ncbi:hypothetical protein LINPERPRIM_LOCUS32787 [Linum perenne]
MALVSWEGWEVLHLWRLLGLGLSLFLLLLVASSLHSSTFMFMVMDFQKRPCMVVVLLVTHTGSLIHFMAAMHMHIRSIRGKGSKITISKDCFSSLVSVFSLLCSGNRINIRR